PSATQGRPLVKDERARPKRESVRFVDLERMLLDDYRVQQRRSARAIRSTVLTFNAVARRPHGPLAALRGRPCHALCRHRRWRRGPEFDWLASTGRRSSPTRDSRICGAKVAALEDHAHPARESVVV